MSAFEELYKPVPSPSTATLNPFPTTSPTRNNNSSLYRDDQASYEGLSSPPLFPSPPKTVPSYDANLHQQTPSSTTTAAPLLTELHSAQTTLIASLCQHLQESTMSHYNNTVQSLTTMYEDRLLRQQQQFTATVTQLQQQIDDLTKQTHQQQNGSNRLQQQYDIRTEKMAVYLHEKHVNVYRKPCNVQAVFAAWKQATKATKQCVKIDLVVTRLQRRNVLQLYFRNLQDHVEETRQDKHVTELKFKYETLSNEMVEEYEAEVSRLRAECTEAYHAVQLEKDSQQQVAEDMRTLFLQHMTAINMQAMTLFDPSARVTSFPMHHNAGMAEADEAKSSSEAQPAAILRSSSGSLSPQPRTQNSPMSFMSMKEDHHTVPMTPFVNPVDVSQQRHFVSPAVGKTHDLLQETPLSSQTAKGHYDKLHDMYKTSTHPVHKNVNLSAASQSNTNNNNNNNSTNRPPYAAATRTTPAAAAPMSSATPMSSGHKRPLPSSASRPPHTSNNTSSNTFSTTNGSRSAGK